MAPRRQDDGGLRAMRRGAPLPADIEHRLATLGAILEEQPAVRFAYLFGGAERGDLRPLSDIDVAVYLDGAVDPAQARLALIGAVTKHLATDEIDLVVLRRKLAELAAYVSQVSEYRDLTVERYRADWKTQRHGYARIDADTVIRILREHLEDFGRFESEALRWL